MKKTSIVSAIVFAFLTVFASAAIAQTAEKGWDKIVPLLSGEVILDMSGEWDVLYENYGPFKGAGTFSDILTITQEGNSFIAVKQIGSRWVPKGAETIKGELDEDGFKTVYHYIDSTKMDGYFEWEECKWEINQKGNKVSIDCGERAKATLTRK